MAPRTRQMLQVVQSLVVVGIGAMLAGWGGVLFLDGLHIPTAGVAMPESIDYLPVALGGVLMALFALAQLRPGSEAVATAPAVATPAPAAASPASAAGVPRLLSAPSPRYPIMAQRRKLEGQVVVQFTIQPDGSVASPRVVSADPPGVFDEAAIVAASRWRFEAGSRSVPSSRVVQFRLGEGQR